ncbi:MAG: helix-turn-helix domain-containing protein [Clostridia bacterium]|nr:helix-turn-helix domain-containing protein [Clostridia bacterium]
MYGQRIKELRIEKNLTQKKFAEMLSTTQSTIGKYEREELQPSIEIIIKICNIFEISSDYLIGLQN